MAPQINSKKSLITTDKNPGICSELNRRFNWFDKSFAQQLTSGSGQFLTANIYYSLFAVTEKPLPIWKGNDYFVTQIDLTWECPLNIKISNIAAQVILDNALGKTEEDSGYLDIKTITELEANILTGYNEFLFQKIEGVFKDKRELDKIQDLENTRKNLIYLTFFVYSDRHEEEESGKIIVSFPEYALIDTELLPPPEKPVDILKFKDSCTRADVFVGKSKLALDEIKNLEFDDLIILEKSNLHFMTIKGDEEVTFSVNPDPRLVINVATGGKTDMSTGTSVKNIWDNLQVEVSAEFKKIKISLGELRQITEGLVVDIAPIVQNEITLHVDGEKIASGELVIIEDKYGVKITKVYSEAKQEQEIAIKEAAGSHPVAQSAYEPEISEEASEEDDDYDNFEIEEDI